MNRKDVNREFQDILDSVRRGRSDEDVSSFVDIVDLPFSDMKALTKKKGIKALTKGKVLNAAGSKKIRKWRKNDKKVIYDMLSRHLQEMYDNGDIGYRKAKRVRKEATKRILSCFYSNED